jgi:hypothetical protein
LVYKEYSEHKLEKNSFNNIFIMDGNRSNVEIKWGDVEVSIGNVFGKAANVNKITEELDRLLRING